MNVQKNHIKLSDIILGVKKDLHKEMEFKPLKILKEELENYNGHSYQVISGNVDKTKSFKQSLIHDENVAVICEYKPASPSMGDISKTNIEDALNVFEKSGASAISILTESKYFKGSLYNLRSASKLIELPIIRKDFVIHEYQIYQSKMAGASAVLFISGVYPDMKSGISLCKELEIDPLVECRNREDIKQALKLGADIIGINNRSFQNFKIDLKTTEKLARIVPSEIVLVSESGIRGPEDAKNLSKFGVDALLVGTSIMGAEGKQGMLHAAKNIIEAVKGARIVRK
jgi:indole-3-glycerol phosphate synthase